MLFDQSAVKPVMSGRNGSVRGEGHFARNPGHRLMEVDALFLHAAANGLQHREPAVPFIEVQDARSDPHGFQCAETSHAQQQLLADANPSIAAIEPRRKFAIFRRVSFHVRIQQQ